MEFVLWFLVQEWVICCLFFVLYKNASYSAFHKKLKNKKINNYTWHSSKDACCLSWYISRLRLF